MQVDDLMRASRRCAREHRCTDEGAYIELLCDRLEEYRCQLENVLDEHNEGTWMARALDAERELKSVRERIMTLNQRYWSACTMTPAIHTAQDNLSEALSYIPNPDQRRLVRHAINRLERAYRDEIMRQQDLALRAAIRDTLPAPAPRGPDLVPVLRASLERLNEQKRRA